MGLLLGYCFLSIFDSNSLNAFTLLYSLLQITSVICFSGRLSKNGLISLKIIAYGMEFFKIVLLIF